MQLKTIKLKIIHVVKYVILIVFAVLCLFPIIWLALSSFKTNNELYSNPWGIPLDWQVINYIRAIYEGHVLDYFGNSVIVTMSAVVIVIILSSMVSFAISRMDWKLSNKVYNLFLLGMMIPIYAMIIPLFNIFYSMKLLNTHLSVIIPHVAISFPLAIAIITGFMNSISRELEEAAVIDGATIYQIFWKIIMPISKSSIVTVGVIVFINVWNDLLLPQIFLTDPSKMTLSVGLTEFQGQYSTDYVTMIAAVIISIIPSIIVYVILHNNIMEGMVAGAIKG
jgi:raffinose/stachyose/melibiose transport system permease protein